MAERKDDLPVRRFGERERETLDPTDVGRALKQHYDDTVAAPLPRRMLDLLARLAQRRTAAK